MGLFQSNRTRWYLLAGAWVVVLILGAGGFVQQGYENHSPRGVLDVIYLTMKLATINYDGSSAGPMNWRLNIARFVVPVMAASTVLQTATVVFAEEFQRFRVRRSSGHTVVVGLGDVGSRLVKAFADAGEQVVGVDVNPTVVTAVRRGDPRIATIAGDVTDPATLTALRVDRAARLVVAAGDDARNVLVASNAAALAADRSAHGKALRCAVQLSDAELANLLRAADLDAAGGLRLSFFSLHDRAARALISEHSPFGGETCRPLVIGLGQFGRGLVVALGQQWAHLHPGERMPITLVDAAASGRWAELSQRHPALGDVCLPELIDLDLSVPSADGIEAMVELLAEDRPTWVAVVLESEPNALASAVFVHQQIPRGEVPIVVRMRSAAGLGTLLDPLSGSEQAFPGVTVFPFLDRTCTVETVDGGIREQLARAVHEEYLAHLPAGSPKTDLQRSWDELDDDQRDLSRRRVDGILADLASIGCDLAPLRRWGAPALVFTDAEVDQLAAREHQRWFGDRTAAGWTHGDVRDDIKKTNPLLVPWDELPLDAQVANVEAVEALQPMLARAGFEAVRR
ncbi:MAG: RyR protein [Acidimicrobiales bacterium]|nr:RyR protein [Acidimicrobiales bacterium]